MTVPGSLRAQSVFIDTSAFYAMLDRSDRWHGEALRGFERLTRERRPILTSNLVVAETYVLARHALGHAVAVRWLESLDISLAYQTESDHEQARVLLARFEDKDFSYTDAVSFVLIERLAMGTAFTFDTHFRQYGIQILA